ncbi:MAG: ABC transporter permease subunit [Tepidisphaeraceae bacterium]
MALILTYTNKVREALKAPARIGVDVLVLVGIAGLIAALAMMIGQASTPMSRPVEIDLSLWALPKYTMLSLMRGVAAYVLSLIFTLIYGTIAAHNQKAEKVMIPALDILQSIPVLGFLPGLVLAMISLLPHERWGLELACVVMIFTAQVWNMTFSFHGSIRSIPTALREAGALQGLSGWQIFKLLEVPAAMIGLVWNSMMSMAGGWFFLTVNEAFQLTIHGVNHDFRLPGIGSYMSEAISHGNLRAEIGAVVAMTIMIIAVDQVIWRPIVVWSQRFKMEDTAASDVPHSWIVELFQRSRLLRIASRMLHGRHDDRAVSADFHLAAPAAPHGGAVGGHRLQWAQKIGSWLMVIALCFFAALGAFKLAMLLVHLPIHDAAPEVPWTERQDWLTVFIALFASFGRVTAAVVFGAAWTLPIGILIGLSPKWSNRLQPINQVLASFPAPMLFPFAFYALVHFHVSFSYGCIVMMLLGAQWYILFNVIAGATSIPAELKEAGILYHMSRRQRWKQLYLPSVFPYLITGLITAAGGAWNATIVAEALTVKDQTYYAFGLGSIISKASGEEKYSLLAAAVVVMSLFVVLLNRVIWKRLYGLAESRYSLNV